VQSLICPHCKTAVDQDALVCLGCGAEIIRGASAQEQSKAGCVLAGVGLLLGLAIMGLILPIVGAKTEYGWMFIAGLIICTLTFHALGKVIIRALFRSKIRFFRVYLHR
jgi:hypothetical protein